ncbi:MAG: hypothetical protein GY943_10310 [Chloroflexi bacterium]|nr:hypothetical protein [Chloroflexota bacterium]
MKQAITVDGRLLIASDDAPSEAVCPHCGGTVRLRRRRRMNNEGTSYFWRHLSNTNQDCRARSRAHTIQFTPKKSPLPSKKKAARF